MPTKLVQKYKNEICDESGKICFKKEKTKEIHLAMLKEIFEIFPNIDGLIIRHGETYHYDYPYHFGNAPVDMKKWICLRNGRFYLKSEFWCVLNAYVISNYAINTTESEEEIFYKFEKEEMKLNDKDCQNFRKICLLSEKAVLKGKYCEKLAKSSSSYPIWWWGG